MEALPIVLAVDDERPNLDTLRRAFRNKLDVHAVQSGHEGLALLRERTFDVALVDFSMPQMNGLEFADEARRLQPDLPVLIVTGYADDPEILEAVDRGVCAAVIAKPWSIKEMLAAIGRFARRVRGEVSPP